MRLDLFLVQNNFFESRQKAQKAIKDRAIAVNDKICSKSSFNVEKSDDVVIKNIECKELKYVSRGGLKLEKAIVSFGLQIDNMVCGDFGASTGGFSHCMLSYGAKKVYAIDVGSGQLHWSLLSNPKIVNIEKTNLKTMDRATINEQLDFIATDVSFISLKHILPCINLFLKPEAYAVCLIKPQFEVGKANVGKNGIVKNKKMHKTIINEIIDFAEKVELYAKQMENSPIIGGDGNVEYLILFQKSHHRDIEITTDDVEKIVNQS